ncbi:hypothetical protein PROFUN_11677 [Planoprotostelium fungivorum]|uniref:Uncharacterized protein n=1 Tax=Planoprotostelium fungivorum TaxID=1890364 RepID=A0A2P6N594_9EUKA|nr:hypothetical protein PROFUN_11677 [Planoprotostelium fungivorum]
MCVGGEVAGVVAREKDSRKVAKAFALGSGDGMRPEKFRAGGPQREMFISHNFYISLFIIVLSLVLFSRPVFLFIERKKRLPTVITKFKPVIQHGGSVPQRIPKIRPIPDDENSKEQEQSLLDYNYRAILADIVSQPASPEKMAQSSPRRSPRTISPSVSARSPLFSENPDNLQQPSSSHPIDSRSPPPQEQKKRNPVTVLRQEAQHFVPHSSPDLQAIRNDIIRLQEVPRKYKRLLLSSDTDIREVKRLKLPAKKRTTTKDAEQDKKKKRIDHEPPKRRMDIQDLMEDDPLMVPSARRPRVISPISV